jgi:carbamoyltransferase
MFVVADIRENWRYPVSDNDRAMFGIDRLNTIRSQIRPVTDIEMSARIQPRPPCAAAHLRGAYPLSCAREHELYCPERSERGATDLNPQHGSAQSCRLSIDI